MHRWAFFVWQPPMSRGTKSTRWPSEPVEQNMTSDLTAFSLMAYKNSLKFMTRARIQLSKNRGADLRLVCLINQSHYDQVPALTQILRSCVFVIKYDFNISCRSCCSSLSEESKISECILGKPDVGPLGYTVWVLALTLAKAWDLHTWAHTNTDGPATNLYVALYL